MSLKHKLSKQWNRIGNLETDVRVYGQLIYDKGAKMYEVEHFSKCCEDKMIGHMPKK